MLQNPKFNKWLQEVENNRYYAYFSLCVKPFKLSNMGIKAVISHSRGQGHADLAVKFKKNRIANFFLRSNVKSKDKNKPTNLNPKDVEELDACNNNNNVAILNKEIGIQYIN